MILGQKIRTREAHLVCVDPGKRTGLAVLSSDPVHGVFVMEKTTKLYDISLGTSPLKTTKEWHRSYWGKGSLFLVYENFHVRPIDSVPDTTALAVLADINEWLRTGVSPYFDEVIAQEPVEGKNLITDNVLRRSGLYQSGEHARHINDAIRHGVAVLVKNRHPWLCNKIWPRKR